MPVFHNAQQVDLHRNVVCFQILAEPEHVSFVDLVRADVVDQVGVSHIGIFSGFHALNDKVYIPLQIRLGFCFMTSIGTGDFAGSEVFSQQHVIHGIILQQPVLFFHQFRNIF